MQTTNFKIINASQAYSKQKKKNSVALDGNPEPKI
jgi:hypothetical protein